MRRDLMVDVLLIILIVVGGLAIVALCASLLLT